jgi:hypothetical protein
MQQSFTGYCHVELTAHRAASSTYEKVIQKEALL